VGCSLAYVGVPELVLLGEASLDVEMGERVLDVAARVALVAGVFTVLLAAVLLKVLLRVLGGRNENANYLPREQQQLGGGGRQM
jgi:hypothetical protein